MAEEDFGYDFDYDEIDPYAKIEQAIEESNPDGFRDEFVKQRQLREYGFAKEPPIPFHDLEEKSSEELLKLRLEGADLFPTAVSSDDAGIVEVPSWLHRGFTMRNLASLQRALAIDERAKRRAAEARERLLAEQRLRELEAMEAESVSTLKSSTIESTASTTQTMDMGPRSTDHLSYLMGLGGDGEEEAEPSRPYPTILRPESESSESSLKSVTAAMRNANKYLRSHKIFQFFQFLIAHLLSAAPENPIAFLLDLLDKCIVYRSGLGCPPLLYEMSHLAQLFNLMDRMHTGFIEYKQYETGMHTLGICSYNKYPPLSPEGMVTKEIFVAEAYDCLTDLLNDMIRARKTGMEPPEIPAPPPTQTSASYSSGSTTSSRDVDKKSDGAPTETGPPITDFMDAYIKDICDLQAWGLGGE